MRVKAIVLRETTRANLHRYIFARPFASYFLFHFYSFSLLSNSSTLCTRLINIIEHRHHLQRKIPDR